MPDDLFHAKILKDIPFLHHGFGRAGRELKGYVSQKIFFAQTKQIHSDKLCKLSLKNLNECHEADAFITQDSGVICSVRTADCVPVLLADPITHTIAAVHAGWRGTVLNIVSKTVAAFGANPKNIKAAIGPCICGNCYEVGDEVIQKLKPFCRKENQRYFVDLGEVNYQQLLQAGLDEKNIERLNLCTACSNAGLASFRKNKTQERQANFISLI